MIEDKSKVNESVDFEGASGEMVYNEEEEKLEFITEPAHPKLTDHLVAPGFGEHGEENGLSPNPSFSGYTKQINFEHGHEDSTNSKYLSIGDWLDLTDSTYFNAKDETWIHIEPNTLFILEYPDGKKEFYTVINPSAQDTETPNENLIRVYPEQIAADARNVDKTPGPVFAYDNTKGQANENTKPKVRPQVFTNPVAFHEDVFYKGKELSELLGSDSEDLFMYQGSIDVDNGTIYFPAIITHLNLVENVENIIYNARFETPISFINNNDSQIYSGFMNNFGTIRGYFGATQQIQFSTGNAYTILKTNLKTGEITEYQL